jgi:DNA-binding CsgD family transcriptional regulator
MASSLDPMAQREQILVLALDGQSPQKLAKQFGVTEWTIRRWVGLVQRRTPQMEHAPLTDSEPRGQHA